MSTKETNQLAAIDKKDKINELNLEITKIDNKIKATSAERDLVINELKEKKRKLVRARDDLLKPKKRS